MTEAAKLKSFFSPPAFALFFSVALKVVSGSWPAPGVVGMDLRHRNDGVCLYDSRCSGQIPSR